MKVYIVFSELYEEIDSVWSTPEAAEKRCKKVNEEHTKKNGPRRLGNYFSFYEYELDKVDE